MNTTFEVSKQTLKIEAYLKTLNPGQKVSYKEIESESGVTMNDRGKQFMRSALNRLKIEYSCIRGNGIELCDEISATGMIARRVIKIDSAVRRADKTTKRVTTQFYSKLSENDKQHVNVVASIFGAIRAYSQNARMMFKRPDQRAIN